MKNNNVIILHQYNFTSHFTALYKKNIIEKYIILSNTQIVNKYFKNIKKIGLLKSSKVFINDLLGNLTKFKIKNKTLIIGIEPGNKKIYKLKQIIKHNKCIYFTSFLGWEDFDDFEFVDFLKSYFDSIAFVNNHGYITFKRKFGNFKSTVVNHSISTKDFKVKRSYNKIVRFLFIGQLIERKKIDLITDFFDTHKNMNISLDIVGKGTLEDKLHEKSLIDKRIHLLGFIDKNKLKSMISSYDYLILPSSDEPFGLVLIEALSAGVPCIISDGIGPREVIQNKFNGFVSNEKNMFKVFLESIELYNNSDQYFAMSKRALESSKKYDIDYVFHKWKELI